MSAAPPAPARIRLHTAQARRGTVEPFTVGLAVPRRLCGDPREVRLVDPAGSMIPAQATVLERWSDSSVRWLLLDFQAAAGPDAFVDVAFRSERGQTPPPALAASAIDEGDGVRLSSGTFSLLLGTHAGGLFAEATRDGAPLLDVLRTQLVVRAAGAPDARVVFDDVEIEARGPLRAAVRITGHVEGSELGVACRLEVFAGLPHVRLRVTLHNPRAAQHPGGFWELGDPGSMFLERASLIVAQPPATVVDRVSCSLARGTVAETFVHPLRLHQESSGRANWQSPAHVTRAGVVSPRYQGYRLTAADTRTDGASATPIVSVGTRGGGLSVTSRLFWEVFPKAYAVEGDGSLAIDVLPADRADDHELQGGERVSHEMVLAFDGDPRSLEWARTPAMPIVNPEWWAECGDVSALSVSADPDHPYEQLVRAAIDGDDTFEAKRDRIDEYGWRHYGDLYADHENGPARDGAHVVSHYNNQYDGIAGLLVQGMRSGDPRWLALAHDLAAHVRTVDIYATDRDKSAYNGGLFWHTFHYVDAGRASHRSYPKAAGVPGGGPSNEHNYSTGLLLHHLMTGDPDSREAVLRLARWTRDMDDGSLTRFRHLSGAPTGLASATGAADYHGPGRGPANGIHTLLNAARLTSDPAWLRTAEALVRRCIHPRDDLEARNLLDAERRWYYTVFLQMLGRFLAFKSERGEEDDTWRYARASLLHYARWMAVHEYPYLDKPEILEYPTETWAAQDMRKCEVFDLAAKYAETPEERACFVERARYFFEQSVATLHRWPTRTWTRPVVLMLSYGYAHLWYEAHRGTLPLLPPTAGDDFGEPSTFEPQKAIAIRRAKWIVVVGLAAALTLAGGIYLYLA